LRSPLAVVLRCGFSVVFEPRIRVRRSSLPEKRLEQGGLSVPGWRVHEYVDKTFFGRSYRKIHHRMDSAFVVLRRGHRVWFHDPLSAVVIGQECYPDDPNAVYAALAHIQFDELCSGDPA
jgi:hypothetical protein